MIAQWSQGINSLRSDIGFNVDNFALMETLAADVNCLITFFCRQRNGQVNIRIITFLIFHKDRPLLRLLAYLFRLCHDITDLASVLNIEDVAEANPCSMHTVWSIKRTLKLVGHDPKFSLRFQSGEKKDKVTVHNQTRSKRCKQNYSRMVTDTHRAEVESLDHPYWWVCKKLIHNTLQQSNNIRFGNLRRLHHHQRPTYSQWL